MGLFVDALTNWDGRGNRNRQEAKSFTGGWVAWLVRKVQRRAVREPRLTLIERICIAPRQTVGLVEVDGQRLLVATSPEGSPSFCLLSSGGGNKTAKQQKGIPLRGTVS